MFRIILTTVVICGGISAPLMLSSSLRAHQTQPTNAEKVNAMIHLDPEDSPIAGKASLTWFMLTRSNGKMIAPANCACQVNVYNASGQVIMRGLPLSTMAVAGHEKGHEAIQTKITFPRPGAYKVMLSGKSKDKSFAPFEVKFSVTVRP
jgi:hypothetical protein